MSTQLDHEYKFFAIPPLQQIALVSYAILLFSSTTSSSIMQLQQLWCLQPWGVVSSLAASNSVAAAIKSFGTLASQWRLIVEGWSGASISCNSCCSHGKLLCSLAASNSEATAIQSFEAVLVHCLADSDLHGVWLTVTCWPFHDLWAQVTRNGL